MATGDYNGAAVAFEGLARGAEGRGGPRAPHLYLQAGRARLLIGQIAAGMGHIRHGLALLAARQQWPVLHRTGQLTVAFLTERGLTQKAQEISDYLKATLPPLPVSDFGSQTAPGEKPRPVLPTTCPGCGGPIRADEVEWVDEVTAECPYCGSAVRGES
ncbi:MAG: hypothetical protein AUK02_02905 [Anaerolineae bacterium CG2_30_58_95]|nr:MAG: hypothetical protein AUK02_02905 [Anaerolineae bacterium CG2_30_58_95]